MMNLRFIRHDFAPGAIVECRMEGDAYEMEDQRAPDLPAGFVGESHTSEADISDPSQALELIASLPDVIFHLAAIVSGEAEMDFEKGYRINLDGSRFLFEAIRLETVQTETRKFQHNE
jgi:nucleoside-diphosphate-sugar epimerase